MADLLSVQEARLRLLSHFKPLDIHEIPFFNGLGRVLAETIYAKEDHPSFANSSMDGFAVKSSDVLSATQDHPIPLSIVGEIPAGIVSQRTLENGQAMRIMTGAPIPSGADAVIPIEEVTEQPLDAHASKILVVKKVEPGTYIRPQGQDYHQGEPILKPGQRLSPQQIGLLASLGATRIQVYRMPRVALLSSGDELLQPDQPLTPGKIRDANSFLLAALLTQAHADILPLGIAADNMSAVQEKMDSAIDQGADLILTSAGVSMGSYDFVRAVIESKGKLDFWRVNIRPGKPIAFGSYRNTPVIGLPGNPVSAFVGYHVFVLPVIERLSGIETSQPFIIKAILTEDVYSDGRESYLRSKVVSTPQAPKLQLSLTGHQGSGNLRALSAANALLIVPSGVKSLPAGSEVDAWLFDGTL